MKELVNRNRVRKLLENAVASFELDLSGISVLTEVGSSSFVTTPLIAALANAKKVYAVCRDSRYGDSASIIAHGQSWAAYLGIAERIEFSSKKPLHYAAYSDLVTNLGFVRPIDKEMVAALPAHSVISLMWEPWEFREQDVDVSACKVKGIPVIGTNENDRRVRTLDYVGALVVKLLFESGIEVIKSNIAIVGSDPFGTAISNILISCGANVFRVCEKSAFEAEGLDALVVAEHKLNKIILGNEGHTSLSALAAEGCRIIHLCGTVDEKALAIAGLKKWPERLVPFGYMTETTDYLGPRAVIDLHSAGLKVGEVAVRSRLSGQSCAQAISAAESTGLGLGLAFSDTGEILRVS